ncbi:MAG TPA: transposase [Acidimicrobiales bacterium]|nr:transposase [Acidimicrobiales bacterium]
MADERLDDAGRERRDLLLKAGNPYGEVQAAWTAKEAVRQLYREPDLVSARIFLDELVDDMGDRTFPLEVRQLARTLTRWRDQILAWHDLRITNGPTKSMNNLAKRVKRVAFGFRRFASYRVRALLYAGKPNWDRLRTLYPR